MNLKGYYQRIYLEKGERHTENIKKLSIEFGIGEKDLITIGLIYKDLMSKEF